MAKFYKVGGAVRDAILGLKAKDIDFAVEAESFDAMREAIVARGGKIFLETPEHFTIRALVPNLGAADYVLCRKDGPYTDGRRPDWVEVGTILDDLARRDFTMNAIAIDCDTGKMIDPFNGVADISQRTIHCVGNTHKRMNEDMLRAIRAIRFAVQKGFGISHNLNDYLHSLDYHDNLNLFKSVSTERIRDELMKMFSENTIVSLAYLHRHSFIRGLIQERGIWLKPTTEKV